MGNFKFIFLSLLFHAFVVAGVIYFTQPAGFFYKVKSAFQSLGNITQTSDLLEEDLREMEQDPPAVKPVSKQKQKVKKRSRFVRKHKPKTLKKPSPAPSVQPAITPPAVAKTQLTPSHTKPVQKKIQKTVMKKENSLPTASPPAKESEYNSPEIQDTEEDTDAESLGNAESQPARSRQEVVEQVREETEEKKKPIHKAKLRQAQGLLTAEEVASQLLGGEELNESQKTMEDQGSNTSIEEEFLNDEGDRKEVKPQESSAGKSLEEELDLLADLQQSPPTSPENFRILEPMKTNFEEAAQMVDPKKTYLSYKSLNPVPGNPEPRYPETARRNKQEGTVHLLYFVDDGGLVDKIQLIKSSGFSTLDNEALRTLARHRYRPGQTGWYKHKINFKLKNM